MKNLYSQIPLFEKSVYSKNSDSLNYLFSKPLEIKENAKYPLVIFLHGSGERGNDNEKPITHVKKYFCDSSFRNQYQAYYLVPQCPLERRWVEVDWKLDEHRTPEMSIPMKLLLDVIDNIILNEQIDIERIYITGLSMGGFGTWDAIVRRPNFFAAAVPICGGGDEKKVNYIKRIPTWIFHGTQDKAVKVERSRNMYSALAAVDGDVIYTEYPNGTHNVWTESYNNRLLWDWLFAQRRVK